jgi:hypothetical protein
MSRFLRTVLNTEFGTRTPIMIVIKCYIVVTVRADDRGMSSHRFSRSGIDIAMLHVAMPVTLQQSFYTLTGNPTCGRTCDPQVNHSQIGRTSTLHFARDKFSTPLFLIQPAQYGQEELFAKPQQGAGGKSLLPVGGFGLEC